jgi:hypothetical protein
MALASYSGNSVPDATNRMEQLARLWEGPIPGSWQRGVDPQLLGPRYRRGDLNAPHLGEHTIEHEILCRHLDQITCFGYRLLDGVNALPLVRDAGGGRSSNVEADLFLLAELNGEYRLILCEVKNGSNDPWYAAVESQRQLRLLMSNPELVRIFSHRMPSLALPPNIAVTALVLAPHHFYVALGKKANAVQPGLDLLARFNSKFAVDVRLAVLDSWEIRELVAF